MLLLTGSVNIYAIVLSLSNRLIAAYAENTVIYGIEKVKPLVTVVTIETIAIIVKKYLMLFSVLISCINKPFIFTSFLCCFSKPHTASGSREQHCRKPRGTFLQIIGSVLYPCRIYSYLYFPTNYHSNCLGDYAFAKFMITSSIFPRSITTSG